MRLAKAAVLAFAALALAVLAGPAVAQNFETRARNAILIDYDTQTVLFEKDADARIPPASLTKLMTSAVIFDAIEAGRLHMDDVFSVSENAWRKGGANSGGSTMFAKLNSEIKVADLIRGIVVQSGNDACIVMAEGMAGTEETFANLMNEESRKIGLTGSHFANATGLPDPNDYMTARDLARLATYIIKSFPEYYKIYGEPEFTWNKIRQRNRNPLLAMNIGADGLKTGFTDEAGYNLVGSAVQNGQRLIVVINGAKSDKERAEEARKLLEWGFRAFEKVNLFHAGEVIANARVFGGAEGSVGVVSKGPVDFFMPRGSGDQIKGEIVYQGPIVAPVEAGQPIGVVRITAGSLTKEAPVFAAADVGTGTMTQRALDGVRELVFSWWPG
ncbi:MAG: D-alanyl-D-alanine carboxypeptidase [Rhizobiales bacterium]|nr:D-alanyl-D-alanine carboxypeptidase [Hyphomicrobiales bacterium]